MLMRIRQISQILFFLLFIALFLSARFPYQAGWPADLFLRASPLLGLTTWLADRTCTSTMILSLVILALTVPFGRFFCGWICPLGSVIDASDRLIKKTRMKNSEKNSLRFRSWKFFILTAVMTAALFSFQAVWFFDPIALLTRTLTVFIYPAFMVICTAVFSFGFSAGLADDQWYALYDWSQKWLLPIQNAGFHQSMAIGLIFIAILALGLVSKRFWCRNLCPLGALLGLFAKFRIAKRYVSEQCSQCGVCRHHCRMNAVEDDYTVNNTVECVACAECVAVCKPDAISYRWGRNRGKNMIDFSRRRFLQASATGLIGLTGVKATARDPHETGQVIRPPGALAENEFFDRCVRCQACVRICSSAGACLQPAFTESGWEGVWSPVAAMRQGYCEYNCNLCGQVCPTGAIRRMTVVEKQKVKMGTAYFDKSRCIPWYRQEDCLVCEEHCPLPDKAIKFDAREARTPDGRTVMVKFPYVREDVCIGCGICETKCPVAGRAGIFVTAAGRDETSGNG